MDSCELQQLFSAMYRSRTETEVAAVFASDPNPARATWRPLALNDKNFGVIENQQSSAIAALIEKITNSIDAILMRKCYEADIDPQSPDAPTTMDDAVRRFFGRDSGSWHENWHLSEFRQKQAEEIQIVADGPRMDTSLVIYDNGEGQHPKDFETTFLSLLKGNKSDIRFVQGKYNMGGTGAIVFCGKRRFQLIGSRRFDRTGEFGFTLVREHPMTDEELTHYKNTWYEYLLIDGEIPHFPIEQLDLGLKGRVFTTGTVIKLYSYSLPPGARSVISRDLNQSINEFLFEPALPVLTVDKAERYPDDKALARNLFGLKRRLEQDESRYVEDSFSEDIADADVGEAKVTCYVFKSKIDGKTARESRDSIEREFFKNNMVVLFSLNGQVHGHYGSEFVTRTLKMPLLKNHLLIHVDCTRMHYRFRKELFMASRDRLKGSDETGELREVLARTLAGGKLAELHKRRKDAISVEEGDAGDLIKAFTRSMPLNSELMKLLESTFKLDISAKREPKHTPAHKEKKEETDTPFVPQRFPSFFRLQGSGTEERPAAQVPLGGSRTVKFETDVENQYFDRSADPGDMQLSLLSFKPNTAGGGTAPGQPKQLSSLLNVTQSSPDKGKIRVVMNPTADAQVGDLIQVKACLSGPGTEHEASFWVKIVDREKSPEKRKEDEEKTNGNLGLPQHHLVYREPREGRITWEQFESTVGQPMDFETIMHPMVEGDLLTAIYINMDSRVLKAYKTKLKGMTEEQAELADRRYLSSVYFHTLFLYTISRQRDFRIKQGEKDVDIGDYLKDIFSSHYSEFLLNFGLDQLMASLA